MSAAPQAIIWFDVQSSSLSPSQAAIEAGDAAALAAALQRNVWRAEAEPTPEAGLLAAQAMRVAAALEDQPIAALLRGEARFPVPEVPADAR